MPLYEYECTVCKKHTEKIQKFSDPEITTCPHCGGELKRVISAPAIAFKGGGWYADGYASAKPSAESKPGEGTASSSDGAGATAAATTTASAPAAAPTSTASAPVAKP